MKEKCMKASKISGRTIQVKMISFLTKTSINGIVKINNKASVKAGAFLFIRTDKNSCF